MEQGQPTTTVIISDEELKALTDAIQQRHGIDFSCYEPKSLTRRIVRALHVFKLNSAHELWVRILKDHSFIFPFMDEISVGLTAMFRDPVLWKKLRLMLTNEFKNKPSLSIWHAGCSTGEEVFTMGIVTREAAYQGIITSHATDISNQALETARSGVYYKLKVAENERNYRTYNPHAAFAKYYTDKEDTITMDASLIRHVKFEYHNLITGTFTNRYDIIFCRNVMIYFDNNAKRKLFEKFHESLNPNGLLIIGFYDAVLPLVDDKKFKVLDMDARIFKKI
jgi:chemotaxis protein methyltransferase CheR